ncbi:hypothetical protein SELMODRAFT_414843 [Selaginella moellendorffii]|uniref:Uncharacterized protein n=1 Tax=Selaginella moellendorffii TaxID=88036 RepID=D8RUU0_SELML|nr:hypothetical protein SELMODRAFT_414843 [Selaginella moellendorffii]
METSACSQQQLSCEEVLVRNQPPLSVELITELIRLHAEQSTTEFYNLELIVWLNVLAQETASTDRRRNLMRRLPKQQQQQLTQWNMLASNGWDLLINPSSARRMERAMWDRCDRCRRDPTLSIPAITAIIDPTFFPDFLSITALLQWTHPSGRISRAISSSSFSLRLDYLPNFPEELLDVWAASSTGLLLVETTRAQLIVTNPLTRRWARLPPLDSSDRYCASIASFQAFPDSSLRVVYASSMSFALNDLKLHRRPGRAGKWTLELATFPKLGFCSDESNVFFITRTSSAEEDYSLKSVTFLDRGSGVRILARWKSLPPGFSVSEKPTFFPTEMHPLPVICGRRILLPCLQKSICGGDGGMLTPALLRLDERLEQWQPFAAVPLDVIPREIVRRMAWEECIRAVACEDDEVVLGLLDVGFQCVYRISSQTWSPLPLPDSKQRSIGTVPFKFSLLGGVPGDSAEAAEVRLV